MNTNGLDYCVRMFLSCLSKLGLKDHLVKKTTGTINKLSIVFSLYTWLAHNNKEQRYCDSTHSVRFDKKVKFSSNPTIEHDVNFALLFCLPAMLSLNAEMKRR